MRTLAVLPLLLAACDAPSTDTAAAPTWYGDVGQLYAESCVGCHTDGGLAPFALDNYDDAATWATASAAAVEARTMPPWGAVEDGTCGEFKDSRALTDEQIATVAAWVDAGTPLGEERSIEVPEAETLTEGLDMTTPSFVPEGTSYSDVDNYRCFLVNPEIDEDLLVTGYEFFPGNPEIVHHAVVMPIEDDADLLARIAEVEAEDGDVGWPCFSGAGSDVDGNRISYGGEMITWTPGQGYVRYPEGYGVPVESGSWFALQIHYNLPYDGTAVDADSSLLRLETSTEPLQQLYPFLWDDFLASRDGSSEQSIPADEEDAVISWTEPWDDDIPVDIDLWGVMPHMHKYGTEFTLEFTNDQTGEETCAIQIDSWDYAWQMNYFYEEPIVLTQGTDTHVTCHYDTSGETEDVRPGWGTNEEMCLIGLFVSVHLD